MLSLTGKRGFKGNRQSPFFLEFRTAETAVPPPKQHERILRASESVCHVHTVLDEK